MSFHQGAAPIPIQDPSQAETARQGGCFSRHETSGPGPQSRAYASVSVRMICVGVGAGHPASRAVRMIASLVAK